MASSPAPPDHSPTIPLPPSSNPRPTTLSSTTSPTPQQPPPPSPPPPPLPSSLHPLLPKPHKIQEPFPPHALLYPIPPPRMLPKNVRSQTDQLVTVVNPVFHPRNPALVALHHPHGFMPPYGFVPDQAVHAMRPPFVHQREVTHLVSRQMSGGVPAPPKNASVVHHEVSQFPPISSASDFNNHKDLREKNRDDSVMTINDRKVRLFDGSSGSLYALCRSWVRNGLPQESQPHFGEGAKLLPRPSSTRHMDNTELKTRENIFDEDEELSSNAEDGGFIEHLSTDELLEQHIKRAKRVRTRLREERLHRIDRYKQRLTLLLPSPAIDQSRNDQPA